ncbi:prepilin-type cleavage/methylation domain-containing protein [Clostridium beijerinckii]|nr:prepilin-type cleavage/methylation domain-containing protein [Clostridium beijerinckii]
MKKYGFTLIETVVSIFILTFLFSIGVSISKLGSDLSHDMEDTAYVYEIQNLLSYGKAVCKDKNKYGKITVKSSENEISFIEGWDNIERIIKLPKEIKIINNDISVLITSSGKISQGNTIKLIDKYGQRQDITIGVGVDLIVIKESEFV